ncbi:MAG TPA: MarR family transcriptional regulator [Blastococcus sp.]|nr:MarR family transcriptional regulator [Blastococcus sp.]
MRADDWTTAASVLGLAGRLIDGIQSGMAARGFDDVRPAHGFAFARISAGDATNADVAEHLGVTKQAASQLIDQLVTRGYVTRRPDPRDARARLLELTPRGTACTRAAESAAAEVVGRWRDRLPAGQFDALRAAVVALGEPGPLRIPW